MKQILNKHYIAGLVQADGSFFISLSISDKHKYGLRIRPKWTLTLDLNSKHTLENVQMTLNGVGHIYVNNKTNSAELVVDSLLQLKTNIIPFFNLYRLHGTKQQAFKILEYIVYMLVNKKHHNKDNLKQLIELAFFMNKSSNRSQQDIDKIYNKIKLQRPVDIIKLPFITTHQLHPQFIVGYIDGDGSFHINFLKNLQLSFGFTLVGDNDSVILLNEIQSYFKVGSIKQKANNTQVYTINGNNNILNVLLPFIHKYKLNTIKSLYYSIFVDVITMYNSNKVLSNIEWMDIINKAYNMNLNGKRRKLTKERYIQLYLNNNTN